MFCRHCSNTSISICRILEDGITCDLKTAFQLPDSSAWPAAGGATIAARSIVEIPKYLSVARRTRKQELKEQSAVRRVMTCAEFLCSFGTHGFLYFVFFLELQ